MKILRPGKKEFTTKCDTCGCLFTYCLRDIHLSSVICPECGGFVVHSLEKPVKRTDNKIHTEDEKRN